MPVGRQSWVTRWVPELVLAAFIALQVTGVVVWDAETQRGTGFAMFSTVDIAATRDVEIEIRRDGKWSTHEPAALDEVRAELVADPTQSRMSTLAAAILDEVSSADEVQITIHGLTADGVVYGRNSVTIYRAKR